MPDLEAHSQGVTLAATANALTALSAALVSADVDPSVMLLRVNMIVSGSAYRTQPRSLEGAESSCCPVARTSIELARICAPSPTWHTISPPRGRSPSDSPGRWLARPWTYPRSRTSSSFMMLWCVPATERLGQRPARRTMADSDEMALRASFRIRRRWRMSTGQPCGRRNRTLHESAELHPALRCSRMLCLPNTRTRTEW